LADFGELPTEEEKDAHAATPKDGRKAQYHQKLLEQAEAGRPAINYTQYKCNYNYTDKSEWFFAEQKFFGF
jgi:hypothetical protein